LFHRLSDSQADELNIRPILGGNHDLGGKTMMNGFKRLLCFVFAAVMMLSVTAFAASDRPMAQSSAASEVVNISPI
jgi:hypothetical protein